MALQRAIARGLRPAARSAMRAAACSARAFSGRKEDSLSPADITSYFLEADAKVAKEAVSSLPIKVGGRVGELLAELYNASGKGKTMDKVVKDMEGVLAAVKAGGLVTERFFASANYGPEECAKVVELLTTTKEPLTSFKDIKDADVKDILVDNEGNLEAWKGARKAVAALQLSEPVKALLDTLAKEGHLERLRKVHAAAVELRAVTSKTLEAVVTSAVPLSKAQQEAVSKALPAYAGAGASVTPAFVVDPAVLGGLTVTLGNSSIDLSVNSRLVDIVGSHQ